MRLIDTKGIEKVYDSGVNCVFRKISRYIKEQNDLDKYIHCIWYCWTGTRLEGIELEILKKLSEQYSLKKLPVIIVYTQAIEPKKVKQEKEYIKNLKIDNDFVEILAEKTEAGFENNTVEVPAYGLDRLMEISIQRAKNAIDSACYEGFVKEINDKVEKRLDDLVLNLNLKIEARIQEITQKIEKYWDIKDLQKKLVEMIVEIFYYFFFLSSDIKIEPNNNYKTTIKTYCGDLTYSISDSNLKNIELFVGTYYKEFLNLFENNLNELVNNYIEKLTKEVKEFRNDFIVKNNAFDLTDTDEMIEDLRLYMKLSIKYDAKKVVFKKFFLNIINPIVEEFKNLFNELYKNVIKDKNYKEKGQKMMKMNFDKIEEKIKKYNEEKEREKEKEKEKEKEETKENDENININDIFKGYDDFRKKII